MPLNNFNLVHCIFEFNGDSYMPKFLTYVNVCCNFRLSPYVDVNLFLQPQYGLETYVSDHGLYMFFQFCRLHCTRFSIEKMGQNLTTVNETIYLDQAELGLQGVLQAFSLSSEQAHR